MAKKKQKKQQNGSQFQSPEQYMNQRVRSLEIGKCYITEDIEECGEGHVVIGHAKKQDVEVGLSVLSVGTVHGQHQPTFGGQQREYHARYQVEIQRVTSKEPLHPTHVGLLVGRNGHRIGKPDQIQSIP